MHFHLPKPMHGWREFTGEVSVIVLGVAIALGAEQVVETLHWRHAGQQAIEGMTTDAVDQRGALLARYEQQPCIDRRLADLGTLFARHDAGQPLGQYNSVGRPFYSTGYSTSWDLAVADGSLAHLSFAERSRFAAAFGAYGLYNQQMWEEKRVWQQLQMLNHLASFTPADWSQARQAYDLASDFSASFRITMPEYIKAFDGFPAGEAAGRGRPTPPFLAALCRPMSRVAA